ncbi:MAG: rubrerythrin family protein [bacterium]
MQKTLENLAKAFAGESQARNRYTMYAKIAKEEGYEQISGIFLETADQERAHAKILFGLINEIKTNNEAVAVPTEVPTVFSTTAENLAASINGEHYETETMYPDFAKQADLDNLPQVAGKLRMIAKAEAHHEERYQKLLDLVKAGNVFEKDEEIFWVCRECGFVHVGKRAPEACPACSHKQAYYQVKCENY